MSPRAGHNVTQRCFLENWAAIAGILHLAALPLPGLSTAMWKVWARINSENKNLKVELNRHLLVFREHQKTGLDTAWLVCHTDTETSLPDSIPHTKHLPHSSSQSAYGKPATSALQKLISIFTVKPPSVLSEVCNWNMPENGVELLMDWFRDDLNLPACRWFSPLLLPSSTKNCFQN